MKALVVKCPPGTEPTDLVVLRRSTVERVAHELRALGAGGGGSKHYALTHSERVIFRALADALYRTLTEQTPQQVALPATVASPLPDPDSSPEPGGAP